MLVKLAAFVIAITVFGVPAAQAQGLDYPNRVVTIVVPYSAGGATDLLARIFAKELQAKLGQPFIVENKAGAGTNIAATAVARAEPNGYTLLVSTPNSNAINKWTYKKLDYDPDKFVPIGMLGLNTFYLVVGPDLPANSAQDLIRLAKERPDGLTYATNGNGGVSHLLSELFRQKANIKAINIPYKGSNLSNADLMAGRVDFMFDGSAISLVNAGRLKALGVASAERWPTQKNIPTLVEQGFRDVAIAAFFGLVAPPGTPSSVVERLNVALREIAARPDIEQQLLAMDITPMAATGEQAGALMREESEKWAPVVKSIGLQIE